MTTYIYQLIYIFTQVLNETFTHWRNCSFTRSFTITISHPHSLTWLVTHLIAHSLTRLHIHLLKHSHTQLFTHEKYSHILAIHSHIHPIIQRDSSRWLIDSLNYSHIKSAICRVRRRFAVSKWFFVCWISLIKIHIYNDWYIWIIMI